MVAGGLEMFNCHIMKKIFLLLCLIFATFTTASAQGRPFSKNEIDSTCAYIATLLEDIDMRILRENGKNRYKLYPTENIYNFLKLDTYTGKIEQIQWSLDANNEGSIYINYEDLSQTSRDSFELYPTKNIYQFLLLDRTGGRAWHVQWGMEEDKRWIRRIY